MLLEVLIRIEHAAHPVERTGAGRCDARLFGEHGHVAVQELVRVIVLRRIPIGELASDQLVVGRDARELRSAEVDVGGQIDAVVAVVEPRFPARRAADELREIRIEAPPGRIG